MTPANTSDFQQPGAQPRAPASDPAALEAVARFLLENPNPVLRIEAGGAISFANAASATLLSAWGVAVGGPAPAEWQDHCRAALAGGETRVVQTVVPLAGGGHRTFETNIVPVPDAGYANLYVRDITAQAQALADLQAERDLLGAIMEHSRASLVYLDPDFNFVAMNTAYEAACQRPRREMIGRNHFELFPNAENEVIFRQVRDTGQPAEFIARPFEFADQPWRGVTYWDWTLTPVKDGDRVRGLIFSLVDVTERVRAAELSNALNDIYAAVNRDGSYRGLLAGILEHAGAVLRCGSATLALPDDGGWVIQAAYGRTAVLVGSRVNSAEAPLTSYIARAGESLVVEDSTAAADMPDWVWKRFGVRACLGLPLALHGDRRGALFFNYHEHPRRFSPAEVEFGWRLAGLVALALENARLDEAERAASAEREAALAELETTNIELEATLAELEDANAELEERVRERTAELEAIFASLPDAVYVGTSDGITRCNQLALDNLGCASVKELQDRIATLGEKLQNRYAATGERILPQDEAFAIALSGRPWTYEVISRNLTTGEDIYQRCAARPILKDGQVIGAVAVNTDITARVRIEQALAASEARLRRVLETLPVGVWITGPEGRTQLVNEAGVRILGGAPQVPIEEYAVFQGWRHQDGQPIGPHDWPLARALERGDTVLCEEIDLQTFDGQHKTVMISGVPLFDERGQIVGGVAVTEDITERVRAAEELQRQRGELQNLAQRLVTVQETERRQVARLLYDDEGQRLSAMLVHLGLIERLEDCPDPVAKLVNQVKEMANSLLEDLHNLAVDLRPASLERLGLVHALREYAQSFGREHGLNVQSEFIGLDGVTLSREVETALYRIAQEALANVATHAHAANVGLVVQRQGQQVVMIVEDDGVGFDLPATLASGSSGLIGMRERARMIGARFEVETSPGYGAAVFVTVPCA